MSTLLPSRGGKRALVGPWGGHGAVEANGGAEAPRGTNEKAVPVRGDKVETVQEPEEGIQYPVLVHHWSDAGFGPADATVLVYVEGSLVYESEPVTLAASSAWYVGVLDGSTLEFTPAGDVSGGPVTVSPLESPMM